MSLNLHLMSKKGNSFNLWQTPTYITFMCLSLNDNDKPDGGTKGVLRRYLLWTESRLNGTFENQEEIEDLREQIKQHKEALTAWIKKQSSHEWGWT